MSIVSVSRRAGPPHFGHVVFKNSGTFSSGERPSGEGRPDDDAQFEELCVDEAAEVRAWRFDALCRSGYESDAAVLLAANADVDLHDAVDLVQRGCPPELAARILF